MNSFWKSTIAKTAIWLAAEILLNVVGLDNIADYSEFVFGREMATDGAIVTLQVITP